MTALIIASFIIMLASIVGKIFTWQVLGNFIKKNLGLLVSFSAGVFLVVVISLGQEVFEHAENFTTPLIWILAGMIGVSLLFRFLPGFHHHHSDHHEDDEHGHLDARRITLSDAVHNIGDGILLAASFSISVEIGIAATISIFVHELVQEISEFFVLKQAGLSDKRALLINFITSGTILIGAIGGYFFLTSFEALEVPLLAISMGAFLVVVFQDLIPESVRHSHKKKEYLKHFILFLLGVAVMFGISLVASHSHEHEHIVSEEDHLHTSDHDE